MVSWKFTIFTKFYITSDFSQSVVGICLFLKNIYIKNWAAKIVWFFIDRNGQKSKRIYKADVCSIYSDGKMSKFLEPFPHTLYTTDVVF